MNLQILYWNANGLGAHGHELVALVRQQALKPHIILIQEAKLAKRSKFQLPGYIMYRKDRISRGGGLVTFVANECDSQEIECTVGNLETQLISVRLANNNNIRIANVYHRVANPTTINELKKLSDLVGRSGLIFGDFNAHSPLWDDGVDQPDDRGRMVTDWVESTGLVVLNEGNPTRHCPITGSWTGLDLAIATENLAHDCTWQVHDDNWGSDHMPCFTFLGMPPKCDEIQNPPERWNFSKADWSKFKTECNKIDSSKIECDDVNTFCLNLTEALIRAAKASIPTTKPKASARPVPWWNEEIAKARRLRKKALNRAKRDKSALGEVSLARKRVKDLITKSKTDSWRQFCETLNEKTDSRTVWRKVHAIRGKRKSKTTPKLSGNTTVKQKASTLAKHFASVSSNSNFSDEFKSAEKVAKPQKQPPHLNFPYNYKFSVEEFQLAIRNRKGTCPGEDMVSYEMLKRLPERLTVLLVKLYNLIWERGEVPDTWKQASVLPLLKPGKDATLVNSYRPISLTSNLCKAMEIMVNYRLKHHLETNGHLSHDQSGYRQQRSCLDHIFRLENDIKTAQLKRQYLAAIFIDFSKAFDMVWHAGLLSKLERVDVKGNMANFVHSFLENRSISVLMGDYLSERHSLDNGTPQGSVISPTLFNIMIDDLFEHVTNKNINTSKFADDGAIWVTHRDVSKIRKLLQETLNGVEKWCDKWGFTISPEKTIGVLFRRKNFVSCDTPRLTVKGIKVKFEKSAKFLGIIFDQYLTWSKHIDNLVNRCQKDLNVMRAISGSSWGANRDTLLTLYRSLIRSKIEYGCEAYHNAAVSTLRRLESVQYQALKLVTGAATGTSHHALLVETGELPLNLRREQLILNYWNRCSNPLVKRTWTTKLHQQTRAHALKHPNKMPGGLKVQSLRTKYKLTDVESPGPTLTPDSVPPWTLETPHVDTTLTQEVSKSENPLLLRSIALSRIDSIYENAAHIYTDGSKDPVSNRTAYGIYISTENHPYTQCISARLPDGQSVYTAELEAIKQALLLSHTVRDNRVVILSDSLSALQSIAAKHSHSRPDTLTSILQEISRLKVNGGKEIHLCWIPSHVDIPGNERADKIAKTGLNLTEITDLAYSTSEIKSMIKHSVKKEWQNVWDSETRGRWYHTLCPRVNRKLTRSSHNRRVDTALTRLRLGYTKTSYKQCDQCQTRLSVSHLLLECPRFTTARNAFRNETGLNTLSIKDMLDECHQQQLTLFISDKNVSQYI